jgi:mannosyl-oligosaccharide alpha-1,2-mannosidase
VTYLMDETQNQTLLPGMWPAFCDLTTKDLISDHTFTLGALADSLYEYLPKMHVLLGGLVPVYEKMYKEAALTIKNNLLFRPMLPQQDDILFSGTAWIGYDGGATHLQPEGQHLACFVGGMFALGGKLFEIGEHIELGAKLTDGCIWAYRAFSTGIMPEHFSMVTCDTLDGCPWDEQKWRDRVGSDGEAYDGLPKGFTNARVPSYSLRPEAIESVFLLYRMTGREELREAAWEMFQSIEKATATDYCNAAIDNVDSQTPRQIDSMESFWLSETLKYFYLIFSPPDVVHLDEWILTTEAHPFKRPR